MEVENKDNLASKHKKKLMSKQVKFKARNEQLKSTKSYELYITLLYTK